MATFHSGSEGQTQKLQALRRRQKRLAFRAVIVPPVCWGICAASAPWWFPPLKEMLGVRFDAQTQGWILLALMLLMISLPVLISLHLKRRARGAKYAATLVSSGIRGEEDARALLSRLPGRVHLYPNRIVHAGNRSECDLVALCRRGATVIEVKNHAGRVTGDLSDHDLLLTRKNGTELTFYNPAMQVTTHAQTLARALAEVGVPCPVKGCVLFIREGTIVRLSDRFHRRRVTPVFTRRNRFRLRWYILHRGKRLRRREVRALRRILEDMK
jgi:NERD domain protein